MQLALRLYYPIDADLIAIRLMEKRNFTNLVRDKLTRLLDPSKKEMTDMDLYHLQDDIGKFVRNPQEPVKVNLNLKDGRDDIMISYLKQIPVSARSDTVKALFRMCCNVYPHEYFPYDIFLSNPKTKILQTNTVIVKKNRKTPAVFPTKKKLQEKEIYQAMQDSGVEAETDSTEKTVQPQTEQTGKIVKETQKIQHTSSEEKKEESTETYAAPKEMQSGSDIPKGSTNDDNDNEAYEMFSQMLGY